MKKIDARKISESKERLNKPALITHTCPICGAPAVLKEQSLDYGNGHGYPGMSDYYFECSGCGLVETGGFTAYVKDRDKAIRQAGKAWDENAEYIESLIANKNQRR